MSTPKLYLGSDNRLILAELHDSGKAPEDEDYYITGATVTGEVRDAEDDEVLSGDEPIAMAYNASAPKPATYQGILPVSVELVEGEYYSVRITATYNGLSTLFRNLCEAKYFTGDEECGCE